VRLKPETHRKLSMVAQVKGVSVNRLVAHQIQRVVRKESGAVSAKAEARAAIAKLAAPKPATAPKPKAKATVK
jgi:hypothetical protein